MSQETVGKNQSFEQFQRSIPVRKKGWLRRLLAFIGPAYLVSIGYMDPGNWATDIEAGSRFGYMLLWVLLMSNLIAVLLQTLSARFGIVTGLDLAQGCRREYAKPLNLFLWVLAEIAIAATDLAEALGTIIGLNLLFGLPLLWGCAVTAFDTFLLLAIQRLGVRKLEAFIVMMVATIGSCFLIEIFLAKPDWGGIAGGFVPHINSSALYVAIGIIGATVMPHNLYLHSSLVQSRAISNTRTGKGDACFGNLVDSLVALNGAFFVNAAILIMAAANFFSRGIHVTEIQQAHDLLQGILGTRVAPIAFGIALLAAGQSSTLTGTLSGQIVMEGFLNLRMRPWVRRTVTRTIALLPAVIVIYLSGEQGGNQATYKLLVLSQVVLSLQLPFAILPLVCFTSDRGKMGEFVNRSWVRVLGWLSATVIVSLNGWLVYSTLTGWLGQGPVWLWITVLPVVLLLVAVMAYIALRPLFHVSTPWASGIVTEGREVAGQIRPIKIKSIAVALEHTSGDAEVISAAIPLAQHHQARLTLLHIVDTPGAQVYGPETQSLHSKEDEAYLEELAREVEERDLPVETMLRYGKPNREIVKAVKEAGFDLLVLGSHGHRGLADFIYGQTVDSVRHGVNIPIMVVRSTGGESERAQRTDDTVE